MKSPSSSFPARLAALPTPLLIVLAFLAVALAHLTLLHLPYYWDEGGYYIPAALDFYHRWTLIPEYTNAHPPLPNVVLGLVWHIVGFHILATRLTVCAFAGAGLVAIFRLTERLLNASAALTVTLLIAVYPIWFAQSSLAHADIFAAAFTLWAFALYLPATAHNICHPERSEGSASPTYPRYILIALLFTLATLSKETAIIEPAILAAMTLVTLIQKRMGSPTVSSTTVYCLYRRLAALSFPLLPLLCWYAYHHIKTGFTFGNPEYLRYNATANFTAAHIAQAIYYRAIHLFWQRNIWLPLLLAFACMMLPKREEISGLSKNTLRTIGFLIAGNWIAFSILGGALLTRYLLPIYPLLILLCVDAWRRRTTYWPALAAFSAAAFIAAIWLNPPTAFAPEDNLTYRDMIVVQQNAIDFISLHYPAAHVLSAWPGSAELFRPDLGYTTRSFAVVQLENFSLTEIQKAAAEPEKFDTAMVFTTHYTSPALARYLMKHPHTRRGKEFAEQRDLSPNEIAAMLHGTVVFYQERDGEWAAVIRFKRSYSA